MKRRVWYWGAALGLPVLLMGAFRLLQQDRALMNGWVFGVVAPVEQFFSRLWAIFPCSVAELLVGSGLLTGLFWLVRALVLLVLRRRVGQFVRRLLALVAVCLWLLAGLDWLWNATYYADGFALRAGLSGQPCTVEELGAVTEVFVQRASLLATRVPRDGQGRFAVSVEECLRRGVQAYSGLEKEFSFLQLDSVRAKPLLCSKIQSALGFTGVYFPFTGEANVNVAAPACLLPATIAHEMAHQRMVAAEEEANFVGIAACLTSRDEVFQYSGYLMGLIHLSNALCRVDPMGWAALRQQFSPELAQDWNGNNAYWAARQSAVENAAEQAYDAFLKGNDQSLGVRSYGACVDLLVTWLGTRG